jgi:hypothetical protein
VSLAPSASPIPIQAASPGTMSQPGYALDYSAPWNPTPAAVPSVAPKYEDEVRAAESGGAGSYEDPGYTLADSESWQTQLENALMLQQLGYTVTFDDAGNMNIERTDTSQEASYNPYGYQYGPQPVYEEDLAAGTVQQASQQQYQGPQDYYGNRYGWGGYPSYDSYQYPRQQPRYYRYGYRNQYYSGYGQRYNYGRSRYGRSYYNRRRRYNNRGDYNNAY